MWRDVAAVVAALSTAHPEVFEGPPVWAWLLWLAAKFHRLSGLLIGLAVKTL